MKGMRRLLIAVTLSLMDQKPKSLSDDERVVFQPPTEEATATEFAALPWLDRYHQHAAEVDETDEAQRPQKGRTLKQRVHLWKKELQDSWESVKVEGWDDDAGHSSTHHKDSDDAAMRDYMENMDMGDDDEDDDEDNKLWIVNYPSEQSDDDSEESDDDDDDDSEDDEDEDSDDSDLLEEEEVAAYSDDLESGEEDALPSQDPEEAFLDQLAQGRDAIMQGEGGLSMTARNAERQWMAKSVLQARLFRLAFCNDIQHYESFHLSVVDMLRNPKQKFVSLPAMARTNRQFAETVAQFYGLRLDVGNRRTKDVWTIHRTERTPSKLDKGLDHEMMKVFRKISILKRKSERQKKDRNRDRRMKLDYERETKGKKGKGKNKKKDKGKRAKSNYSGGVSADRQSQRVRRDRGSDGGAVVVVGADAKPLNDSNIGHRMLQRMGWEPGRALGVVENGRTEPVEAVKRPRQQGLGFSS